VDATGPMRVRSASKARLCPVGHELRTLTVMFLVALGLGCNVALPTRATPREPLDALWERRMLEGRAGRVWLDEHSRPSTVEEGQSLANLGSWYKERKVESFLFPVSDPYAIFVRRDGEGLWRNGSWTLTGGPLRVTEHVNSTVALFVKTIIRTPVHTPTIFFHSAPPTEVGYEFFLVQRAQATGIAIVIRRWVVQPAEVLKDRHGYPRAEAVLTYEASTQVAAVAISGLKRPVLDRVDVSAARSPQ